MGKTSTKPIFYAFVLPLLLLQFTSLVSAVTLTFYANSTDCSGIGIACDDAVLDQCCGLNDQEGASVSVRNIGPGVPNRVFGGGICSNLVSEAAGPICLVGGGFTGAAWGELNFRRRALLDETVHTSTTPHQCSNPTSLVYVKETGRWVVQRDDATELFLEMKNVPGQEVEDWITGNGGIFEPELPRAARAVVTFS